jgi:exonuclease III
MKIISWNMNKATTERLKSWKYLLNLNPDIALLQEVNSIPDFIKEDFKYLYQKATNKDGSSQKFGTAVLVKGEIVNPIQLVSQSNWVNQQLDRFTGIFIPVQVTLTNGFQVNVISVHSPAWDFDSAGLDENEKSEIKLKNNSKIWGTELLWSALTSFISESSLPCIVGGDFNSSTTFDFPKIRGNQEVLDRMDALNLKECLYHSKGVLTPTYKNARDKEVIHQIDHLFVSSRLIENLEKCDVEKVDVIFEERLSDHLPIIADFSI